MSVIDDAVFHQATLKAISSATSEAVRREWASGLEVDNLDRSFYERVWPRVTAAVEAGQLAAASLAEPYARTSTSSEPVGRLLPGAFSGISASGRDLDTLLTLPLISTKQALKRRLSPEQAKAVGGNAAGLIAATETTDAGRTADGVAIAIRPGVAGYVRLLTPPSCARCAILAGRFYRWSDGFERHPQCNCTHVAVGNEQAADPLLTDPNAAFKAGNVHGLSYADERAIREGADISQVVNSRTGMYVAGGQKLTYSGTSRNAWYGRNSRKPRLRPEQIYKEASSREEAISTLREYGYFV